MDVWLIQTGERLPLMPGIRKLRTALLAEKLAQKGHTVCWWASAFDHFSKEWVGTKITEIEAQRGLTLKLLKGIGYKKNISLRRYIDHRVVAWKFKHNSKLSEKPDVMVIATPAHDIAYYAMKYAKSHDIPAIVDIRDPWPDIFLDNIPYCIKALIRLLLFNDFRMIEYVMQEATCLIAVSETFMQWGLKYAKRQRTEKDKVFYLGYHDLPEDLERKTSPPINSLLDEIKNRFVVVYIGSFSSYHNPEILVDCAKAIDNKDIAFVLAGMGENYEKIKKRAAGMPNVYLPGWLDQAEIEILLRHSHVGACVAPKTIDLFPNKAFLYLASGLPIISSLEGDLKELIELEKMGYYYEPGDLDGLVNSVSRLANSHEEYNYMAYNAKKVFRERFSEDFIYDNYINHILSVINDEN
ncbi:MAG: glycosyltransferase family 4 protein [Actinobacteria bacterium]|nr:glycosyltransferase family 4 protein [Actinomycetota bacterium]